MNKKLFLLAIAAMGSLASCNKDDASTTPTPSPSPTPAPTPSPAYTSGHGAVVALITRTTTQTAVGPYDIDLGTGVAVFGNLSTAAYTDAGTVTLNGKELAKQTNGSYVFIPTALDATGISDLDSKIDWTVGTPAFSYSATPSTGRGMPKVGAMDGTFTTIDLKSDFTLGITGTLSNADSIYYQIASPNGKYALKRVGGTTRTVTFTAAELKDLGTGIGGSVVIAAFNHQLKTFSGKDIHFINELALARTVEMK
ncbi:MAG: hypothetical protein IT256_04215 [Chitinophagaceae bacterium]|nr:hypothetical protein [Chitinophagaceae bacterium]